MSVEGGSTLRGEEALVYAERFGAMVVMAGVLKVTAVRAREILARTPIARPRSSQSSRAELLAAVVVVLGSTWAA